MGTLLFQLGRLDAAMLTRLRFVYLQQEADATLSSLALQQILSRTDGPAWCHLFFPVSLPFNSSLAKLVRSRVTARSVGERDAATRAEQESHLAAWEPHAAFLDKIEEVWADPEAYLKDPAPLFEEHPHVRRIHELSAAASSTSFTVLPSFGSYSYRDASGAAKSAEFRAHPMDVQLAMLAAILHAYFQLRKGGAQVDVVAIDTSCGLNVYVGLLWAAFRFAAACMRLYHVGADSPRFAVFATDPVVAGSEGQRTHVHELPLEVKAFFDYPPSARPQVDDSGRLTVAAAAHVFDSQDQSGALEKQLIDGAYTWAAAAYGLPLYLASRFDPGKPAQIDNCLEDVLSHTLARICTSSGLVGTKVRSLQEHAAAIRDVVIALCLQRGLVVSLNEAVENVLNGVDVTAEFVSARGLYDFYRRMADMCQLPVARTFVRRELERLGGTKKKGSSPTGRHRNRNFFAHCGLLDELFEKRRDPQERRWFLRLPKDRVGQVQSIIAEVLFTAKPERESPRKAGPGASSGTVTKAAKRTKARPFKKVKWQNLLQNLWEEIAEVIQTEGASMVELGSVLQNERLRARASELIESMRTHGLYGPCLYWAERFGIAHGLNEEQVQEALRDIPIGSPHWKPSRDTVRKIEDANFALACGESVPHDALAELQGVAHAPRPTGVWIRVPGLRDFFAPQQELPASPESLIGKTMAFTVRAQPHSQANRTVLNAASVRVLE